MGRVKGQTREGAKHLREQGWALRRIANELGVALSTVSVWVRDVAPALPAAVASPPAKTEVAEPGEVDLCRCGRCGRDLPRTSFNRHPTGRQWWCRDCFRSYFGARGELHREQSECARGRRRKAARVFIHEYLDASHCADCGEDDALVLEFDHLHSKRGNVTTLVAGGASPRRLQQELAKCEVVCVNCHRVRTATRGGSWRLKPERLENNSHLVSGERRNMIYIRELLMSSACVDCGERRLAVLDFDHVGTKTAHVTELGRRGCSLRRLQEEVAQCEIRCGNCHRLRTTRVLAERQLSQT